MEKIEKWDFFEVKVQGKASQDPYFETITGSFKGENESKEVDGFYNGNNEYVVRFMPSFTGHYSYKINGSAVESTIGEFEVTEPTGNNKGMVRVANTYHFVYEDGDPYYSVGTTAYAWVNQKEELQEQTIETLKSAGFNKMRFCIFPKHYDYNMHEPITYPFERENGEGLDHAALEKAFCNPPVEKKDTDFNYYHYNIEHFKRFDLRIKQLRDLNIQADIIIFHPYDRWGNSCMTSEADDRYLQYVVARYSAYRNVWWAFANEYDLMFTKSIQDWERFASIVLKKDVYHHLRSIHNCIAFYDHSRPWITHCSLQRQDLYRHVEYTDEYRERWQKPIVWDEIGYEGNINWGWGNLTPEEEMRRFWEASLRGGYCGHGETYVHPENILWWSHGGKLHGQSPARIRFLYQILSQTPGIGLKRYPGMFDETVSGVDTPLDPGYRIYYYGFQRPSFRDFLVDHKVKVEVIDTWNMTIENQGEYEGSFRIQLPARQWMAVRLIPVK